MAATIYIYALYDPEYPGALRYVGQSSRIKTRINKHYRYAMNGERTHKASWIRKVNRNGRHIAYLILAVTEDATEANRLEEEWMRKLRSDGHDITNVKDAAVGGTRGLKWSEESRKRLSAAKRGVRLSEETKMKLSAAHRGKRLSDEHRENIRKSQRGKPKPKPDGFRNSGSFVAGTEPWNKGLQPSDLARQRMSEAQLKRYREDPLARERLSIAHLGRVDSLETRSRKSQSARAAQTPELRALKSAAMKRIWAERRVEMEQIHGQ